MNETIYDLAGIGIGPFNLGLAALCQPITPFKSIFFDTRPGFDWHPGLMLDFAKMQVPFYADMVTGADPTSPYSYFSYLKKTGRLYQFSILEDNYISRRDYNDYCIWVAGKLPNLRFGHGVQNITYNASRRLYNIETITVQGPKLFLAKKLVVGTGSVPFVPGFSCGDHPRVIHSAQYLFKKAEMLEKDAVTIVGSGQSAAEIFYDLITCPKKQPMDIAWFTKSARLFPMDTSKFSIEMTSPDYIDYFYNLPNRQKTITLQKQDELYKGINAELLAEIYKVLYYRKSAGRISIQTNCTLKDIKKNYNTMLLALRHTEQDKIFEHETGFTILATGYKRLIPSFLHPILNRIKQDGHGRYEIARNYSVDHDGKYIFIQNAELHSHGFNAPDLGMGPYRNATIINAVLGFEYYQLETNIAFQTFGTG